MRPNQKPDMNCMIATSETMLDRVYELRYRCYRRDGSIVESSSERFSDKFDRLCNSFSVLAESATSEALATVRISVVQPQRGWQDSPAQHVYGDDPLLRAISEESYVEASRLCFGPTARRGAFMGLTGYMAALAEYYETNWLVACPRVEHVQTYQRLFGFRPLAAPRQYYGVRFQTQLLGIRRTELAEFVRSARPMMSAWAEAFNRLVESDAIPEGKAYRCSPCGTPGFQGISA